MSDESEPTVHSQERSVSQDAYRSSGRGGAGNIRASRSPTAVRTDGPDDFSATRGREMDVTPKVTHSGRGGAGNIRSPSRDANTSLSSPAQAHVDMATDAERAKSTGRGGFGNISRSRSRSRPAGAGPVEERGRLRSSGRGGAGNIVPGSAVEEEEEDGDERRGRVQGGIHSTGRGGIANLTSSPAPAPIEASPLHDAQTHIHSAGRGGVGNIREASRSRSKDGRAIGGGTGIGGMWGRVMSKERKE